MDRVLKYLDGRGIHGHKNRAFRTESGIYVEGEPFDYEVFAPSKVWCFDAKECSGRSWPISKAKLSQVNALKKCKNSGAEAFFLVFFSQGRELVKFDVDVVIAKIGERGSLAPSEGVPFDWQVLLK